MLCIFITNRVEQYDSNYLHFGKGLARNTFVGELMLCIKCFLVITSNG